MLQLNPALGRAEAIASLTTTTTVVSALATGGSAQKYIDKWMMRADSTNTADRVRRISNFAPTTGTLTHSGTNYADTTATNEIVEIHEFEPYLVDNAVQVTLARLHRIDRTELPTIENQRRVWLGDVSWVLEPSDIVRIAWSDNPVLNKNRYFEKYSSYNASGVLAPDFWTLTGAGATMARTSAQNRRGSFSLEVTRANADCTVSQSVTYLPNGVTADDLRGKSIIGVAVVRSSVASQVRVQIFDGTTTTSSAYHTGGGLWEELSCTATMSATASNITVQVSVETSNTAAQIDECYLFSGTANTDDVRRDNWPEVESIPSEWEQNGTLSTELPIRG
jgi:hypothetical protein